jgi:hypothetical protein
MFKFLKQFEDYNVRRTEIKTQLRKRRYTNAMVEKQLKKVDNLIICEYKAQFFPHALHPFSLP